jgi:lipoprotein-anchoring transpeptidase ErfK/SrfK
MMHPRPRFVFRFFGVLAGTWLAVSAVGAEPVVRFVLPPPPVAPEPVVEESAPEPVVEILAPTAEPLADAQPVTNWLEAQVELARRGFSSGSIDGVGGAQSAAALRAFQAAHGLAPSGTLDRATRGVLVMTWPALRELTLSTGDVARLQILHDTWVGKSEQTALDYETALELIAERAHASPKLIQRLNPAVDWTQPLLAGAVIKVPAVGKVVIKGEAAKIHVRLAERVLQVRDAGDKLLAHFPVSIAKKVEKRPVGELRVIIAIANPDYTFDPAMFPESEEAKGLGRKLILPPGPNNPVGVAWIGLDRPGYGIHGTPKPEQVGRTESHGCFRLANWDAETLLPLAWVGLTVVVDP